MKIQFPDFYNIFYADLLISLIRFNVLFSGECHLLPSCPWHPGHCGLRRTLQLLGQRRSHQVEDVGAARPAHHRLLLQPQRQHLCLRLQLRLVKGTWRKKVTTKVVYRPCFCNGLVLITVSLRATSTTTPRRRTTSF